MGYDVMAPGNHDFQWPSVDTLRNLRASRFPWVCANLIEEKTGKPLLEPCVVREIGGVRVAFFGLIPPRSRGTSRLYKATHELGLKVVDPIETARRLVPEIRRSADIVILLSHLGVNVDEKLPGVFLGSMLSLEGIRTAAGPPRDGSVGTPTATSLGAVPVVQAFQWGSRWGGLM